MNEYTSRKIRITSFLLMIMVVFLHSYNIDIKQGGHLLYFEKGFNWIVQNFISNGLTRIAVPLFFLISGFLLLSKQTYTIEDYKGKILKRFRTLFIPYIFWALLGLLVYFTLQSIPQSAGFFTKKLIKDYSFAEFTNAVFNEPIPYQLWFLKDLMVMVLLSPLIYILTQKLRYLYLLAVAVFWVLNQDTVVFTSEALLFFSVGIYIQLYKKELVGVTFNSSQTIVYIWMLLLAIKTAVGFYDFSPNAENLLLKASILVGIISFWKLLDVMIAYQSFDSFTNRLLGYSFFIYVFHEPVLTIVKKALFVPLPKTPPFYLVVYFLAPIFVIITSILLAYFLKSKLSFVYKIITGNR